MWDWLAHPYCVEATSVVRNGDILAVIAICTVFGMAIGFAVGALK